MTKIVKEMHAWLLTDELKAITAIDLPALCNVFWVCNDDKIGEIVNIKCEIKLNT